MKRISFEDYGYWEPEDIIPSFERTHDEWKNPVLLINWKNYNLRILTRKPNFEGWAPGGGFKTGDEPMHWWYYRYNKEPVVIIEMEEDFDCCPPVISEEIMQHLLDTGKAYYQEK